MEDQVLECPVKAILASVVIPTGWGSFIIIIIIVIIVVIVITTVSTTTMALVAEHSATTIGITVFTEANC